MKILYLSVFLFGLIAGLSAYAQDSTLAEKPADTLIYLGGRSVPANITNITSSKIFYANPENDEIIEADRKQVERIIYRSGRIEVLNRPVFEMVDEDDWRHVFLTEDPGDVETLYERGPVEVTAAASRNRRLTVRNAEIRLKKQAAGLKANMILVTNTEFRGGYGDIPSITMKGIAYGFMPPADQ